MELEGLQLPPHPVRASMAADVRTPEPIGRSRPPAGLGKERGKHCCSIKGKPRPRDRLEEGGREEGGKKGGKEFLGTRPPEGTASRGDKLGMWGRAGRMQIHVVPETINSGWGSPSHGLQISVLS